MRILLLGVFALLASVAFVQVSVTAEMKARAARLEKACGTSDAEACFELAHMYWTGKASGWIDDKKGMEVFRKGIASTNQTVGDAQRRACDGGQEKSCVILGAMHASGDVVEQDSAEAARLFQKACGAGSAYGCFILGDMYSKGEGVASDHATATGLFEKACTQGFAGACNTLAVMHTTGEGLSRDPARAEHLYEQACAGGFAASCFTLGYAAEKAGKDLARAVRFYKLACDGGNTAGCAFLARARTRQPL